MTTARAITLAALSLSPLACGAPEVDGAELTAVGAEGVVHGQGQVFGTDGAGLHVRAAPNTSSAKLALLPDGTAVGITCQTTGELVGTTSIWNKIAEHGGYVSDAYVWTGYDTFIPGMPKCGTGGGGDDGGGDAPTPDTGSCEYAFFRDRFDAMNGGMEAVRDASFAAISAQVASMQAKGSGVTLGGMLSLLQFEGAFGVGWYNDLCAENVYGCWSAEAAYGYQLGFAPVHLSNYHPCASDWNAARRDHLLQRFLDAGFQPSAAEVQSVAGDLHAFCSASVQPTAVEYYILRVHDFGVPWDAKGNHLAGVGSYPFFEPSIMIDSFFDVVTHMGNGCEAAASDTAFIADCFGGGAGWYKTWEAQQMILASWVDYQSSHCP